MYYFAISKNAVDFINRMRKKIVYISDRFMSLIQIVT